MRHNKNNRATASRRTAMAGGMAWLRASMCLAVLAGIAACSGAGIDDAMPTIAGKPQVAEVPKAGETVRGEDDPAIVTLDIGGALREKRLSGGDELPANILIPTTNLNAVPVSAALQAVLAGTDMSLSWDTGTLGNRLVTVVNLSGSLPKVVEKICGAAKVFCDYRHGSLELSEKETFIVSLPPIAKSVSISSGGSGSGSTGSSGSASGSSASSNSSSVSFSSGENTMVNTITELAGDKVQVDDQGGNIIYTTTVDGEDRVKQYLAQLRQGRPLIVLQMYVWEVSLNKDNGQGINWSELQLSHFGPGFGRLSLEGISQVSSLSGTAGNVSLGAVTTGRLNTNSIISFLATKGRVQTISSPQITFVSGSNAEFKVGGTQRYISQVGQIVSGSNVSGTTNPNQNTSVGTNTVNTDSIDTGLTVDVSGSFENGVVFANLGIALRNLISLNPTNSAGGTIDLPQTSDESIGTVIRVRPGDNLVMAGMVSSNDVNNRQGLPGADNSMSVPLFGEDTLQNHELVVIVKPSVVLFSEKNAIEEAKKTETTKPLPDAVVIDKDGSRMLAMPAAANSAPRMPVQRQAQEQTLKAPAPQSLLPTAAPQPELMQYDPYATPFADMPSFPPNSDGAPVDKRLMQRGFSRAYNDMLDPGAPDDRGQP